MVVLILTILGKSSYTLTLPKPVSGELLLGKSQFTRLPYPSVTGKFQVTRWVTMSYLLMEKGSLVVQYDGGAQHWKVVHIE